MTIAPIQTRFDGGEISQRLSGRFDSELYKKALRQALNFEPLGQGSLRMRSGSLLSNLLNGDPRIRLIRIRVSTGQDYLAVLLDKKLNLYVIDGDPVTLGESGVPEPVLQSDLITNGTFALASGAGWQSKLFGPGGFGGVFFTDPAVIDPTTNAPLQLGFAEIDNGTDGTYPILYQKIVVAADAYGELKFKASITDGKNLAVKISTTEPTTWADQTKGGEVFTVDLSSVNPFEGGGTIFGPPFAKRPDFNDPTQYTALDITTVNNFRPILPFRLNAGTYYLSYQITSPNPGGTSLTSMWIDNVSLLANYINPPGGGTPGGSDIPTPWTADEVAAVQYDTETGRDRTIFCHPNYNPWQLTFVTPGNWNFGNVVFAGAPASWSGRNFPACVQNYNGRNYYAGEPGKKNRVIASKANSLDDLTIGSNPGDGLDFEIATKGAIRWLESSRLLLVGTDIGHYIITGSTGIPLVGDVQVIEQSNFQAAPIQAVKAGTHALFVSSDLRRIRATAFDLQSNGWEAKDLTFASEHITAGLVKELHHGWTPDSVNVLLLQDGTLAVCTFEPVEQVLAWWTVNVGASIASAAVAQGPKGAYVWMAVFRNGAMCLERLALSEGAETLQYVDSYKLVAGAATVLADGSPATVFVGLGHLAGMAVRLVLNGIVIDTQVPPAGDVNAGKVILSYAQTGGISLAGMTAAIGVPFKATGVTMRKNTKTGKAHSSKIGVILNNSAFPKINKKRVADRSPATSADTIEPLFTGQKTIVNLGWSDGDEITIEQDLPFRTEVCALYSITEATE